MFGAFATFLVLYGLLYALERKRTEVDGFSIASVVGIPLIASVLAMIGLGFLYPDPLLLATVPLAILLIGTFLMLKKFIELPTGRSLAYTVVVLVVNVALAVILAPG